MENPANQQHQSPPEAEEARGVSTLLELCTRCCFCHIMGTLVRAAENVRQLKVLSCSQTCPLSSCLQPASKAVALHTLLA